MGTYVSILKEPAQEGRGITDSMDMSLSKLQQTVKERGVWHDTVHRVAESWT